MDGRELRGVPASPGVAVGAVRLLTGAVRGDARVAPPDRPAELQRARSALAGAADELDALAARLAADGRDGEAEIVATGALMALDPGLDQSVARLVADDGLTASDAILTACAEQADLLAGLADTTLAARADDVRSLGR